MSSEASTQNWPGAFSIYGRSKEAVMVNIKPILGLIGIYILASIAVSIVLSIVKLEDSIVSDLIGLILGSAVTVSITHLVLAGIRGQKMELQPTIEKAVSVLTLKMALLSVLTGLIAVASLVALIVPFFFIVPRIVLAPYFLIDKKLGVIDSLSASWDATKGSIGKVWGVIGVSVLFGIAILVLVGIYLSIMYAAAFALLYLHLAAKPREADAS